VSDLHAGSIHGLKYSGELNPIQVVLRDKWEEMIGSGRFSACFVLGDCCDGVNRKSEGYELYTTSRLDQVEEAVNSLSEIKTNHYYGVHGSEYHVDENTSMDLLVIKELHGTFGTDLTVPIDSYRFHLAHKISAAMSAPHNEIIAAVQNEKYWGKFDMILRAHRHKWLEYHTPDGHLTVVPGWKGRDSFMKKQGLRYGPPICGWVVLNLYPTGIQVEPHLFVLDKESMFTEISYDRTYRSP